MELTIDQALQKAVQDHKAGRLQDADNLYRAILQAQPNHPAANHNLGVMAVSLNKTGAALPLFKIALEANPNQGQFWLSYVDALIKEKQFDKAREVLEQGKKRGLAGKKVDLLEAQLKTNYLTANALVSKNNLHNTSAQFEKVSTKKEKKKNILKNSINPSQIRNPSKIEINNLLEYYQKGHHDLALNLATTLTQQHPNHPFGWKVLCAILQKKGKFQESIIVNQKVLEISPNDADAHNNLGVTLQELGRLEDAATSYKKAIEIKPDYADAHSNLGNTLKDLGRLEDAETSYKKAIEIKPDYADAHSNLGNTLKDLRRLEDAETSYKKAIAIKPDYAQAHSNLGIILQELGRLNDAETSYKKAIAIKPGLAEVHYNLGILMKELGRLEDAETSYQKAISIKPDYAQAHNNLGITLQELGRLEGAAACYKKTIEIKPDFAVAHSNLCIILQELGRLKDAETSLHRSLEIKSSPVSREIASPVIALLPFGRSGSLFLHSLFDGHPDIATLPGVYFKGWFGMDSWQQIAPDMGRSDWRERLVSMVIKKHLPLFDANNKQNVPGKPFGDTDWLSKESGFMEMGNHYTQPFVVDQNTFSETFLTLLRTHESIDTMLCFELIHRAFEIGIRGNEGAGSKLNGHIFYHIHNPDPFERAHFLQHYPQAMFLHLIRNPVQSLESWLMQLDLGKSYGSANYRDSKFENNYQLKNWSTVVNRIVRMAVDMRLPDNRLPGSRGVRLEDVKQNPRKTMPQLADWMGVSDHPALYESSFCGLQYWGPTSKAVGKITGFDTKAIDQPIGRLFGPKDVFIFETLFWPLSRLYGYSDLKAEGFRRQLMEIRPWLDEPLEFENKLYSSLPDKTCNLKDLPQYRRLHHLLHLLWNVLDREGTYQDMVQPLKLD
jgi:tetratricopeptide (TPR) repeat protein